MTSDVWDKKNNITEVAHSVYYLKMQLRLIQIESIASWYLLQLCT